MGVSEKQVLLKGGKKLKKKTERGALPFFGNKNEPER